MSEKGTMMGRRMDSPALRERAAWLSGALLSIFIPVLTIPSLQRAGWLKWGVTATSEDYIIPTKIKGSSDIWIAGRFDWSTPCLFHSMSGVSKQSRFLEWVFRELLCHRWECFPVSAVPHSTFVPQDRDLGAVLKKVHTQQKEMQAYPPPGCLKNSSVYLVWLVTVQAGGM